MTDFLNLILQCMGGGLLLFAIAGLLIISKTPLNLDKVALFTMFFYMFFLSFFVLFAREQIPDASTGHMSIIVLIHGAYQTIKDREKVFPVFKRWGKSLWNLIPISKKGTES